MKFVDVTNDLAFRKIFGNENKKEVLISFLNAILLFKDKNSIISVDILNPYQLPTIKGGKVTIVDLKAKDQNGNQFIVEMQVAEADGFDKRVLYYASKSYESQIERGDEYKKLKPTFFIGILDFKISKNKNYISRHKVVDIQTGENIIKDIEFNFIELPKFNKKESELDSIIDQWVYFIKNSENLDVIPSNISDSGLKIAYQEADKHNWTKQELETYDYVFMREQDNRGILELAEKKALEKGMEEGMEKGMEKGIEKGKLEEKFEIAKQLLINNVPIEIITSSTGLNNEEIEKLNQF